MPSWVTPPQVDTVKVAALSVVEAAVDWAPARPDISAPDAQDAATPPTKRRRLSRAMAP